MVGSGIGGMTTAVLMAKVGKKVLVLEQHDQAGGCCHTFIDKGYEFDVGIHYIGEVSKGELNRTLVDQITDGQLGNFFKEILSMIYWKGPLGQLIAPPEGLRTPELPGVNPGDRPQESGGDSKAI